MKNKLDNNVFGGVDTASLARIQKAAVPDSRIRLCSSLMTTSKEVVPISEALVAFDPKSGEIQKFIAAFVSPPRDATHRGIKYLISKGQNGDHRPVVIAWNGEKKKGAYWNPHYLTGYLDWGKLPMNNESAEFRILRAYRAGVRATHRFELLNFDIPPPGEDVDKRTMKVEIGFNGVPPIHLARCYRNFFWWQKQIVHQIGTFAGVDLNSALGLGIKRKLDQAVQQGDMPEQVAEDILHDHSEDPVEVSEPLAASFGLGKTNMVKADEGQDFYVPTNPMLKTMPDREEEEETVELFD